MSYTPDPPPTDPPAPDPVMPERYLMGLDRLAATATARAAGLRSLIDDPGTGASALADVADSAAADAGRDLQAAVGADQLARQALAAASTEQEYTDRAAVAKAALADLVAARIEHQDTAVALTVAEWKLDWLRRRSLEAGDDETAIGSLVDRATADRIRRKALVAAVDDLPVWRQNLIDKLLDDLPRPDPNDTLADVLNARRATMLDVPPDTTSIDNPSPLLFEYARVRLAQFAAPPAPSGPSPSDDLANTVDAVDDVEAGLGEVQPIIRAQLEQARGVAAEAVLPGLGLSSEDFTALESAMAQDDPQTLLQSGPPAPPDSLAEHVPLLVNVPPAVWSGMASQAGAEADLVAALDADGLEEREAFVAALGAAEALADERKAEIEAAQVEDASGPEPPDALVIAAYGAAATFPYGTS